MVFENNSERPKTAHYSASFYPSYFFLATWYCCCPPVFVARKPAEGHLASSAPLDPAEPCRTLPSQTEPPKKNHHAHCFFCPFSAAKPLPSPGSANVPKERLSMDWPAMAGGFFPVADLGLETSENTQTEGARSPDGAVRCAVNRPSKVAWGMHAGKKTRRAPVHAGKGAKLDARGVGRSQICVPGA